MIIVVVGPTGVGKTKLSIELAKRYNAEIINGDSVQVYSGLDIGTAKIKDNEMEGIVHHLINIHDVSDEYTLYDYQKDARNCINHILGKGKNVIIVGGTGLYIKSALYDYHFTKEEKHKGNYDDISTIELYNKLMELDPLARVDQHNRRRIVRAIDYYYENNESISTNNNGNKLLYDAIFIGLTTEKREELYERINDRVDKMINEGLIDEVRSFYNKGIFTRPLMNAIGYKELYRYFQKEISLDEAILLIKRNSRRYAKRQYTFFNNQFNVNWFFSDFNNFDNTINDVVNYIEKNKDYISRI